jgi:hypothetical protein
MWDFYMVRPKGLESMIEDNDSYTHMKDMLASELSTLSQRTNFFIVTQSVLFGALAFAFQNIFPYMFPILLSVIGIVGTIFCILTIFSGRESSQSLIRWRLSMKELEGESEKTPWNTYYRLYNNKHKEKDSIIDNSPLPYMWLFFPCADSGKNGHDSVPNRPPVRSNRPPSGKGLNSGAWVTIV